MRILIQALAASPGASSNIIRDFIESWPDSDDLAALTWRPAVASQLQGAGAEVLLFRARNTFDALMKLRSGFGREIERAVRPDVVWNQHYAVRSLSLPQVTHYRNLLRFDPPERRSPAAVLRDRATSFALEHSTLNVFNSESLLDAAMVRYKGQMAKTPHAVVYNPVSSAILFASSSTSNRTRTGRSHGFRIFVPQSDYPHKRLWMLPEILDEMDRISGGDHALVPHFVVAGMGDYESLRTVVATRGYCDRFSFPGFLSQETLLKEYADADAVLLTSNRESFCNPVVEAHAFVCPVVVSDIPVVRELKAPSAHLCPTNDISSYAAALVEVAKQRVRRFDKTRTSLDFVRRFSAVHQSVELRRLLSEAAV